MGYTHYWSFNKAHRLETKKAESAYQKAIKECNKFIQAYQSEAIGLNRLSGYSAYTSEYGGIKINGKQKMQHEDFTMREHFNQNEGFHFCKTARKPYDIVVVGCLIILKAHLGELIDISSDGYAEDWIDGQRLVERLIKKRYTIPLSIKTKAESNEMKGVVGYEYSN